MKNLFYETNLNIVIKADATSGKITRSRANSVGAKETVALNGNIRDNEGYLGCCWS
jgi:hypothetical protein